MTVPQIKVKVQRRPVLKLKVLPKYPASITGEGGIEVENDGGNIIIRPELGILGDVVGPGSTASVAGQIAVFTDPNHIEGSGTEIDDLAPLDSPALTGTPTAPTAAPGTNTTQIATTAYADRAARHSDYDTVSDVEAATIPASIDYIRVAGYSAAGDGGRANYKRSASEPSHDGKIQSDDGAWWELDEVSPNELMFGAVSGASNATKTAAIQSLFDYSVAKGIEAQIIGYGYVITSGLTGDQYLKVRATGRAGNVVNGTDYHFVKGFNGDVLTVNGDCVIDGLFIDGDGNNFTGRNIYVADGNDQRFLNVESMYSAGPALEVAANEGARLRMIGGHYASIAEGNDAVLFNDDTSLTSSNRILSSLYVLHNVNAVGPDNLTIMGCVVGNLITGSNSRKVKMTGCRVSNAAIPETMSIAGTQHSFTGNIISGDVDIAAVATAFAEDNIVAGTLSHSAGSATNKLHLRSTYTPTWTASSVNPAIGNGSISGAYQLDGNFCVIHVRITAGSTTTFGTGDWSVSLPFAAVNIGVPQFGDARVFDSGTGLFIGVAVLESGGSTVQVIPGVGAAAATGVRSTVPMTWTTSDRLEFQLRYRIN